MATRVNIREPFNAVSHLIAAVLILCGTAWMATLAPESALALSVFGLGGALMFGASTAYHWGREDRQFLRRFDHAAIYIMIASSYTPLCLLGMQQPAANWILGLQWVLALAGVVVSLSLAKTPTWLRLLIYISMGWMALPLIGWILPVAGSAVVTWLLIGGGFYTVGAIVYSSKKPDPMPDKVGFHGLWHMFVIAGAFSHWFMAYKLLRQ